MARSKRRSRRERKQRKHLARSGSLTIDRRRKSGHYQGTNYSEVYRDGKVYVYTAWNDNEDVPGKAMGFEAWAKSLGG